jgi:beta-galactosidase
MNSFKQGVAYYPDYLFDGKLCLLPSGEVAAVSVNDHISHDLARMKRDGLSILRIGEFAWQHLEPKKGELHFERFHFTLDSAHAEGLEVMFCTPTACPPAWLIEAHPDILPNFPNGTPVSFGSRRHYDPLNPAFREHAHAITTAVVNEFKDHPAIIAWQLDNEWGHHGSAWLWSSAAEKAFHLFLSRKYNAIAALNKAWFTAFWSQAYSSFEQIPLPRPTLADHNPSLLLDYRRFCTSVYKDLQKEHLQIVKTAAPKAIVTHNYIPSFFDLCPWEMAEDLDIVGYDHYQVESLPTPDRSLAQFSLMKSLHPTKPFMVLEQQPLQVNWQTLNRRIAYDWLLLWSAQARAAGANAMLYFSWQRFCGGPEQYHDGVLSHDVRVAETKQEKVIKAISQFHAEVATLLDLTPATPTVLILLDTASLWTHDITAQSDAYKTLEVVDGVVSMFSKTGMGVGFISSLKELENHSATLVVLPGHAFALSDEEKQALLAHRNKGGFVLSLPRTALKDRNAKAVQIPLDFYADSPLLLLDGGALGSEEREAVVAHGEFGSLTGRLWAEHIQIASDNWEAIAHYREGIYAQAPAALLHTGSLNGKHIHLATVPEWTDNFYDWLRISLGLTDRLRALLETSVQILPIKGGYISINFGDQTAGAVSFASPVRWTSTTYSLSSDLELIASTPVRSIDRIKLPARSIVVTRELLS